MDLERNRMRRRISADFRTRNECLQFEEADTVLDLVVLLSNHSGDSWVSAWESIRTAVITAYQKRQHRPFPWQ